MKLDKENVIETKYLWMTKQEIKTSINRIRIYKVIILMINLTWNWILCLRMGITFPTLYVDPDLNEPINPSISSIEQIWLVIITIIVYITTIYVYLILNRKLKKIEGEISERDEQYEK